MSDKLDRAEMIQQVMSIRNACDAMLDILVPDAAVECVHPPEQIVDLSTMGDPEFECKRCGKKQDTPFHNED